MTQPSLFDHFARASDPVTSKEAAAKRSRKIGPEHLFCLRWHSTHQDSDSNAGLAAFEAGLVGSQEAGRRASRTIREDLGWTEFGVDPQTGEPITVANRNSTRRATANFLTPDGYAHLEEPTW